MQTNEMIGEYAIIHIYSRAQAIEDRVLVDLMQDERVARLCREHYKHPIAMTATVWQIVQRAVENPRWCNDLLGVLHDVLWMSRVCFQAIGDDTRLFRVIIKGAGRQSRYTFKMVCGPGDAGEPTLTIMVPEED